MKTVRGLQKAKTRVGEKTERAAQRTGNEKRKERSKTSEEERGAGRMKSSDKFASPGLLPFKPATQTHAPRFYYCEKALLCKNLPSLSDGFLICFSPGFQSQFWHEAKWTGQKTSAGASLSKKEIHTFNFTLKINQLSVLFCFLFNLVWYSNSVVRMTKKKKSGNSGFKVIIDLFEEKQDWNGAAPETNVHRENHLFTFKPLLCVAVNHLRFQKESILNLASFCFGNISPFLFFLHN